MKLPPSFQKEQPKPIFTSNDKEEIIPSDESLFKGRIYRNSELPDDVRVYTRRPVRIRMQGVVGSAG